MFDAVKVKNDCVQWIRDWFEINGTDCNAVIGISGGKDSSVVAALCVEALGKDRVIGVMMPNNYQRDLEDAKAIIKHLGIRNCESNIHNVFNAFLDLIIWSTGRITRENTGFSDQTRINLAPRIRMTLLYAISQTMNGRVACTDNLSESYIGYSTRWGDNVGDFSPLANLTSDEVVAIGDACGLPYELTHKTPADGLCGKTDEDNFGFTYEVLNKYILTGECEDEAIKAKIDEKHQKNLFKLQPIPTFVPSRV
jgi:NAD+ synthase